MSADIDFWAQVPKQGFWPKLWFWLRFWFWVKTARLRFIAILIAIGAMIAYWDTLRAYYEKWTRPTAEAQAASADTEYFCPMHPQIVRDNPKEKCPICFMPLSKRKKGEGKEEALPPGVVSRVQLSPYRVALAGVQTWEVSYQPLAKLIETVGFVEFDERKLARISARVTGRSRIDKLYVNVTGQTVRKGEPLAELYSPDLVVTVQNLLDARRSGNQDLQRMARDRLRLWGIDNDQVDEILKTGKPITHVTIRSPIGGHVIKKYQVEGEYVDEGARLYDVADLSTVWVQAQVYEDELALLKVGTPVSATTVALPDQEFTGKLSFIHPHLDQATRTLTVRFDIDNPAHELRPGMYGTVRLQVPASYLPVVSRTLAEDRGDHTGLVLAVPESAVIDTGSRKVVYRQDTPGVFEGIEVRLGPRMTGPDDVTFYPVLRGLEGGDRVVTSGSFLIDAETRLNPAAGSIYFGGSAGSGGGPSAVTAVRPTTPADEDAEVKAARTKLRPADRKLVEAQEFCPVLTGNRLGSMGVPVKVIFKGQPVFLCCKGCEDKAKADPDKTLAQVEKLKAKGKAPLLRPDGGAASRGTSPSALTGMTPEDEAEIKAALAKLGPEDRRLAEAQRFCAVMEKNPLGSMGKPVKVMIKDQPVFLCCDGCEDKAKADPDRALRKVEQLKTRVKGTAPPDRP